MRGPPGSAGACDGKDGGTISRGELNILMTCVGRRVQLMEAFRQAMSQLDVTGRIVATDVTTASPAFHRADEGVLVP
ncbi:MAG: hypothetical protein ACOC8F_06355, partial [Planctomycetota bacterium]